MHQPISKLQQNRLALQNLTPKRFSNILICPQKRSQLSAKPLRDNYSRWVLSRYQAARSDSPTGRVDSGNSSEDGWGTPAINGNFILGDADSCSVCVSAQKHWRLKSLFLIRTIWFNIMSWGGWVFYVLGLDESDFSDILHLSVSCSCLLDNYAVVWTIL